MRTYCTLFTVALMGASLWACDKDKGAAPGGGAATTTANAAPTASAKPKPVTVDTAQLNAFGALVDKMEGPGNTVTPEKVELGKMLYFDARLSKNHDVSCNSCHDLEKYGVDGKKVSEGHKKQTGTRNSPTVYNAAGHFAQFWDGRAATVEEQATKPITNPVEMAMPDEKRVVATLKSIPQYEAAFKKAFPEDKAAPISLANVGKAIGAFERTLVTPSRWDKFIGGDQAALTDEEKAGFNKFIEVGCQTCHQGRYVGGTMYQKLGLAKPWPGEVKDQGRFEVTKQDVDKLMFKVPSLRNVEKTGPYMHDGSIDSLEEITKMMAKYQLGKDISDADVKVLVAFMKSMTGELPKDAIKKPELPPSTPKTPKPDPS